MLGTIVNVGAIIIGTIGGVILKKGIKKEYEEALFNAMGFVAIIIGANAAISHMSQSKYPVLFIVSLALGSLIGSMIDIDDKFQKLISKFSKSNLGQGLSTAILLCCIGTLSILGPVMSAIYRDNTYLFTNATLDFVSFIVFAATYGIGMMLAAPVLFMWQGSIYMIAVFLSGGFFTTELVAELSIVGGILIASSGLSILKIKDCKTLNMLPALFIPIIFFWVKGFFGL